MFLFLSKNAIERLFRLKFNNLFRSCFYVLFFILLFVCSCLSLFAEGEKITLQEILDRHINALGRIEKIQKTKSRIAYGEAEFIPERNTSLSKMIGKAEFYSKAPNKIQMVFDFGSYGVIHSFDGSNPIFKPTPQSADGNIIKILNCLLQNGLILNDIAVFDGILIAQQNGVEIKLKGKKQVNNREAYQIEIKYPETTVKVFIDTETFLKIRTSVSFLYDSGVANSSSMSSFKDRMLGGKISGANGDRIMPATIEFDTEDFQDVNGVKLPFSYIEHFPFYTIKVRIKNYEENVEIDNPAFQ